MLFRSPELSWIDAPASTKSFALIVHDPDAPHEEGFYHWLVLNIPADKTFLNEGETIESPMEETINSFGFYDYGGACPITGEHRYTFTVYALDVEKLKIEKDTPPSLVERMVLRRTIAKTTLMTKYTRLQ